MSLQRFGAGCFSSTLRFSAKCKNFLLNFRDVSRVNRLGRIKDKFRLDGSPPFHQTLDHFWTKAGYRTYAVGDKILGGLDAVRRESSLTTGADPVNLRVFQFK